MKYIQRPVAHVYSDEARKKVRTALNVVKGILKVPETAWETIVNLIDQQSAILVLLSDISEDTLIRNGKPSAHRIFGIPTSIQSVMFSFNQAVANLIEQLRKNNIPEDKIHKSLGSLFSNSLSALEGQSMEWYFRGSRTCPSEEQFLRMIDQKVNSMINVIGELSQMFGKTESINASLMSNMGRYLQMRKELKELTSILTAEEKDDSLAGDLSSGKYSLPIIHAIHNFPEDKAIETFLSLRTNDFDLKRKAVQHLEKLGSIQYTQNYLDELKKVSKEQFAKLYPKMENIFDMIDMAPGM